jgi:hypothetical protein
MTKYGIDERIAVAQIKDSEIEMIYVGEISAPRNAPESPENLLPTRKVCFFKLKNKKYVAENGAEITTEMLVKHAHVISDVWSYIVLD